MRCSPQTSNRTALRCCRAAQLPGVCLVRLGRLQQDLRHRGVCADPGGGAAGQPRGRPLPRPQGDQAAAGPGTVTLLQEYRWCGSARNCNSGYFKW